MAGDYVMAGNGNFIFAGRTGWELSPNRLSQAVAARRLKNLPILDLTETNPTRAGFAYSAEILTALQNPHSLIYAPDPRGPLEAREAVCAYYAKRGASITPEQVFLTTSSSEAYSWVFRLLADPGDYVLVPQPSYPLFDFLAGLNDVRIASYPLNYTDRWQIDLDALRGKMNARTRAVLVVHPNNPTGSFASAEEFAAIEACCQENRSALITDEVFLDYSFGNRRSEPVLTHAGLSEALSFTLSGLSKIAALPQMKLGWIVANGPENVLQSARDRLEVIADTYLSMSAPLAYALPGWLAASPLMQSKIIERLALNMDALDRLLGLASGIRRLEIEGGWSAVLQARAAVGDEECAIELLEKDGVLVHPGHFYDFPTEGYFVLSLLTEPALFREGVSRILARIGKSR